MNPKQYWLGWLLVALAVLLPLGMAVKQLARIADALEGKKKCDTPATSAGSR